MNRSALLRGFPSFRPTVRSYASHRPTPTPPIRHISREDIRAAHVHMAKQAQYKYYQDKKHRSKSLALYGTAVVSVCFVCFSVPSCVSMWSPQTSTSTVHLHDRCFIRCRPDLSSLLWSHWLCRNPYDPDFSNATRQASAHRFLSSDQSPLQRCQIRYLALGVQTRATRGDGTAWRDRSGVLYCKKHE